MLKKTQIYLQLDSVHWSFSNFPGLPQVITVRTFVFLVTNGACDKFKTTEVLETGLGTLGAVLLANVPYISKG